jgi:hypothetical protein
VLAISNESLPSCKTLLQRAVMFSMPLNRGFGRDLSILGECPKN